MSYLGSAAAMAFAPSTPILFQSRLNVFSEALKNPTEREMCEFSACGHPMKVRIAAFESARRAASYLGSTAAMAFAPSTPIKLSCRLRSVNEALNK